MMKSRHYSMSLQGHSPQENDVESTTKDSEKGGHTDTSPVFQ